MGSLKDLSKRMKALDRAIKEKSNGAVKAFASGAVHSMTYITAVDTSKALSNWRVSIGNHPAGFISPHVPGTQGSTRFASGKIMEQIAYAQINMRVGNEDIHLYNNVEYIVNLETSHPVYRNMVPRAIESGLLSLRNYWSKTKLNF